MISNSAQLIADHSASKSQAESATRTAKNLLEELNKTKSESKNSELDSESKDAEHEILLRQKEDKIAELIQKLELTKLDLETMKKQSEGLTREYDNLTKENEKLLKKVDKLEMKSDTKKDN